MAEPTSEQINDVTLELFSLLNRLSLGKPHNEDSFVALAQYKDMPKLDKPDDYHEKIKLLQGYYRKDPLFKMLINGIRDFATDGHDWEVISIRDERLSIAELKTKYGKNQVDSEREESIWCAWDNELNLGVGNMFPGTGNIDQWIVKQALLTGMAPLRWKFGEIDPDEADKRYRPYSMPIIMINYPSESIRIEKPELSWDKPEEVYVKKPSVTKESKTGEQSAIPTANISSQEIENWKNDYEKLTLLKEAHDKGSDDVAFVIKYEWSPGDVSIKDKSGEFDIYRGLYPDPPYEDCIPWLMMRESLWSSDLQILDGLINMILAWFIGNEKYAPKGEVKDKTGAVTRKSDFTLTKELIENLGASKVVEMFLPWWLKPEFISPPTDTLLNAQKYSQATIEILQRFGIFGEKASIKTRIYEQQIMTVRNKVLIPFWEMVTRDIIKRNNGIGITTIPNRRYNPLPFSRDEVIDSIKDGHKSGEVSTETYLKVLDIDPDVERIRTRKELARGDREIFNELVPVQFSQAVVDPGGKSIQKTTESPGRPKGKNDEIQRKPRKDGEKT